MKLCDYGCGQEAKYQFKNGKWCCNKNISLCLTIKEKIGKVHRNKKVSKKTKLKISLSLKGKTWLDKYNKEKAEKMKKKRSRFMQGNIPGNKFTIKNIKKKYPFFSQIEEMRYNPDNIREIQVHCKNHNCPNSKEQGGWFTPTYIQLYERIRALEKPYGMIENNFYCCEECKKDCPLYDLRNDPFQDINKPYTQQEYKDFKEYVLKRDNYICQYCGEKATEIHHERPQKLEPFFALDPDNGIACCEECHYKYGHKTGTECSTGNLANKIC
jgi:hypothetical protein